VAEGYLRPAWAEVDLGSLQANVSNMCRLVAPARLCAVVKADAYGHGALEVARAALRAGASFLAVALPEEGIELREGGVEAPILLLSEPVARAMGAVVDYGLTPTVYRLETVATAAAMARVRGRSPLQVHLKVDTGMHRVGADPERAVEVALAVQGDPHIHLEGLWTHLAVADQVEDPFTAEQLRRFEEVRAKLSAAGVEPPMIHAANSAGAMGHPASRYGMVRCGVSLYGYHPARELAGTVQLSPVLSLRARVSMVRELPAGERVSYGRRWPLPRRSWVATVPLGYADGVPRSLPVGEAGALIKGRRRVLAGTVTMDQLLLDCGPEGDVAVGDEVVLLGRQGAEEITADDWARATGTISYEILCGIGPRVPRVVMQDGRREGQEPLAGRSPPAQRHGKR
jgi:alanine racemase